MRLVYEKPASRWGEALPLGNGQIGAMVYGGADCEEIDLTELRTRKALPRLFKR